MLGVDGRDRGDDRSYLTKFPDAKVVMQDLRTVEATDIR